LFVSQSNLSKKVYEFGNQVFQHTKILIVVC
jgi:hypothetical protein